jgi:hypothetical protein
MPGSPALFDLDMGHLGDLVRPSYPAAIRQLPSSARIERGTIEQNRVPPDLDDFGFELMQIGLLVAKITGHQKPPESK